MQASVGNTLKVMPHKAFSDAFADLEGFGSTQPIQREIHCQMLAGPPPFRVQENLPCPPVDAYVASAIVTQDFLDLPRRLNLRQHRKHLFGADFGRVQHHA